MSNFDLVKVCKYVGGNYGVNFGDWEIDLYNNNDGSKVIYFYDKDSVLKFEYSKGIYRSMGSYENFVDYMFEEEIKLINFDVDSICEYVINNYDLGDERIIVSGVFEDFWEKEIYICSGDSMWKFVYNFESKCMLVMYEENVFRYENYIVVEIGGEV